LGIFAMLYAIWLTVHTMIYGNAVPGYASLMIAVLTLGSINIVATGILGEYVGRIYNEVRNRPLYLVRETMGLEVQHTHMDGNTWNAASINASINSKAITGGSSLAARSSVP
jgi:hypothetical protein